MAGRKILVVLGHPDGESLCGAMAEVYINASRLAGNEVRCIRLGELAFDPVLRHGYKVVQPLEPDLVAAQEDLRWAAHLVFVYPNWWGAMPALLKGFIDRVFLPGFAFKYRENSPWWDRLLTGRTAQLLVAMDTPPWYYRWAYRMPGHHQMKRCVLGFCGISRVSISSFGTVKGSTSAQREKWLKKVARLAAVA